MRSDRKCLSFRVGHCHGQLIGMNMYITETIKALHYVGKKKLSKVVRPNILLANRSSATTWFARVTSYMFSRARHSSRASVT